jgi:hypothetical protein
MSTRAAEAYLALAELAETVEDEWQYVTDLVEAYLPSIAALAGADGGGALTTAQVEAVDEAIAEIALITDPHRAIDWLSTFPHVVGLALDGDVDRPARDGSPETPPAAGDVDRPARDGSPGVASAPDARDGSRGVAPAGSEANEPEVGPGANEPDEDSPFRILGGYR